MSACCTQGIFMTLHVGRGHEAEVLQQTGIGWMDRGARWQVQGEQHRRSARHNSVSEPGGARRWWRARAALA
jgi:hypothetical protein